jgi:hypothetical protein
MLTMTVCPDMESEGSTRRLQTLLEEALLLPISTYAASAQPREQRNIYAPVIPRSGHDGAKGPGMLLELPSTILHLLSSIHLT